MSFYSRFIPAVLLSAGILLFSNCSGNNAGKGNDQEQAAATGYDSTFATGKVLDNVVCRNQGGAGYALYLPSHYTSARKWPCIYFFDSHARGSLPLRTYKDIAEKYGFIFVGSNVSKNGTPWPATNEGAKAMMDDTRSRLNIDASRIYTCGFSGGSRVASSVAIFDGGVAGVIGCAAGFPDVQQGIPNKFDFFGIVGEKDFNLPEMEQLDEGLEQDGLTHQLLTSQGIHSWPVTADFETALLWMQVNAMKEKLQPATDMLVAALKKDLDGRISAAKSAKDLVKANQLLSGAVRVFTGLSDVSAYKTQQAEVTTGASFKAAVARQSKLAQEEMQMQQELAGEFTTHDEKWWTAKIAELNKSAHTAPTQPERMMYTRVVNYLGLVGYMTSSRALNTGDLHHALTYLQVFKTADPQNADCSYLMAIYYMKKQNPQSALSSLTEAASLGYSDVGQMIAEPAFAALQGQAAFKTILDKVSENYSSK